mmetsp:Transcript_9200/g.25873  ORF Transcript_9200/g.25873 Transcript_9200/m.25873 type:complete len:106 (-) Transcript_9200:21-338(-)
MKRPGFVELRRHTDARQQKQHMSLLVASYPLAGEDSLFGLVSVSSFEVFIARQQKFPATNGGKEGTLCVVFRERHDMTQNDAKSGECALCRGQLHLQSVSFCLRQ